MKKLLPLCILLFLFAFALPASAEWNASKDSNILGDPDAKVVMDFVENMPWIADGADTGKYLYVLADAGCTYTKQLYTMSRKYTKDVQIRWIFIDGQAEGTYNSLYEDRTPKALDDAFMSQTLPEDNNPEKAAKIDKYDVDDIASAALHVGIVEEVIGNSGRWCPCHNRVCDHGHPCAARDRNEQIEIAAQASLHCA